MTDVAALVADLHAAGVGLRVHHVPASGQQPEYGPVLGSCLVSIPRELEARAMRAWPDLLDYVMDSGEREVRPSGSLRYELLPEPARPAMVARQAAVPGDVQPNLSVERSTR